MKKTRFAPSPTGWLHLGHAYAAHIAWQWAHELGGECLLRFEDIDTSRVREPYYAAIEQDLTWLGFHWSSPTLRQTTRSHAYTQALHTLQNLGAIYPCFCTRREITQELTASHGAPHPGEELIYPGTCRHLTPTQIATKTRSGRQPCWRLHSAKAREISSQKTFQDRRFGTLQARPDTLGDVIIARNDLGTSYHLAVVLDDAHQGITHISRGEDLLPSTHIHLALQHWLQLPTPQYWHHPLLLDASGKRLAKRHDSLSIRTLRHQGLTPQQIWENIQQQIPLT